MQYVEYGLKAYMSGVVREQIILQIWNQRLKRISRANIWSYLPTTSCYGYYSVTLM